MAWGGPTFLAEDANDSVATTSVVLTGITAGAGALVVVTGRFDSGGGGITGFSAVDSAGNTWNVFQNGIGNSNREAIISSVLTNALSAGNITVSRLGTTNITSYSVQAVSYTGAATGTWEDTAVRAFTSGNGYSTTVTGGTAANSGDLVISSLGYNLAGGGMSFTEDSTHGWTTARTTTATNKWNNQAYVVNSGTAGIVYSPTPSGGAPGGSTYTLLQTAFIAAGGGGDVTVALTGSSATAAAGNLGSGNLITLGLTGSVATTAAGNVTAGADKTIALTGSSVTASAGNLSSGTTAALAGSAATAAPGNIGSGNLVTLGLTGISLTSATGTITVPGDKTVALVGQSMTALAGTLTASIPQIDAGLPLTRAELARLRQQARKRDEQIEAAWAARKAERQELQDQLWRAARKGKFDGADRPQTAVAPIADDEDEDIEFLLLFA